jgi:acid stress-induced BolA-like protein IbaG/YrbA
MVSEQDITHWLQDGFVGAHVCVTGDGRHFEALVVSDEFSGVGRLARHRQVYRALGDKVGGLIHALSITALTCAEHDSD